MLFFLVPFAIEENSGIITVVDDVGKYKRFLYDFEAMATNGKEITLITNVTIHIVDSIEEAKFFTQ